MNYWQKDGDSTTAVMKFYGAISFWYNGANDFTNSLKAIEAKYSNLEIRMHCYGGDVFEGIAIFNALKNTKLNVTVYIEGIAASMASIVMLAAKKIWMAANAFVMIHAPSTCAEGGSKELFSQANLLKKLEANFSSAYKTRTGKDATDLMDGTDHWLDSEDCKTMKLVDEVGDAVDVTGEDMKGKPDAGTPVEKIFGRYTALTMSTNFKPDNKNNMDKNLIIAKMNLKGVTADSSDTAVLDALVQQHNTQEQCIKNLETAQKNGIKTQATALIAAKETALKTTFTEEQKTSFLAVAENAGIATLTTVLAAVQPVPKIAQMITPEGGTKPTATEDRSVWTFDTWQEKDPKGLENLPKDQFEKLYLAKYPDGKKDIK